MQKRKKPLSDDSNQASISAMFGKATKQMKIYTRKEIVYCLMTEQGTVTKKHKHFLRFICGNPKCKGKAVDILPGKGIQNAYSHLESKSCYGKSGINLQVNRINSCHSKKYYINS